ncbi:E3 ubiquitin-protein ligase [Morus notabilis]|uniref:E3 ubiquitin-protein ligase RMA n=1 Tax=Morus notabilis TaxID=981085 RepID=W9QRE2_9ROSA|nr:E3 ubiquitin-protein ligase RMA3 [Morus notabilis]XP_024018840.1 E3 ubiquitin-protein ligase RMA3 [Morus notabilis]EXB51367.1 E3 ubiquitin-protein ligase [Morus notabilis]
MEQNFFEPEAHFESNGDVSVKQKWKSMSATSTVDENESGCFECNICLDSANEPVVTLCGHLYCWPCIYKWLQVQSDSDELDQQNCPVCKANISHASLVPLYGRGTSRSDSDTKKPQLVIPRRPLPSGLNAIITSTTTSTSQQNHPLYPNYFQSNSQSLHQQYFPHPYGAHVTNNLPPSHLGAAVMTSLINPTIEIFGEMVFARIFGSSGTSLFSYSPPIGSSSPRMRRHEVQVDRSLNRVSIFLFCCIMLCLLLF